MDTRLYISATSGVVGTPVDLYDEVQFNLSYSIADIREPEKRNTTYSKTITIPGTKANNILFQHIFEIDIEGGFNPNQKAYAIATADTIEVFSGIVQLLRVNILVDKRIEYEIALKGTAGTLFSEVGDGLLQDLDLSEHNHIPTKALQATSWSFDLGLGYVYPLIDNGLQAVTAVKPIFESQHIYPGIYVKTLWDQIFAEASFTYTSDFLNTDFFKRLFVYSNKRFPQITVTFSGRLQYAGINNNFVDFQVKLKQFKPITGETIYHHLFFSTVESTLIESTAWSINVPVDLGDQFNVAVFKPTAFGTVQIQAASTYAATYQANPYLGTADFLAMSSINQNVTDIDYTVINFQTEIVDVGNTYSNPTHTTPVIPIKFTMKDGIKQKDFLMSIIKAFNLYVWENREVQNNLFIEPRDDFYLTGNIRDLTDKLDRGKQLQVIPMGELDFKTFIFNYKEDRDYYNTLYKNDHTLRYGQKTLEIENDFLTNTTTLELIFAPTPSVSYPNTDMVFPSIVKEATNNQDDFYGGEMRLLYYGGLKPALGGWTHRDATGDTTYTTYPYCGHLDDPYLPTYDILFDAPKEVYWIMNPTSYTDNALYNRFYSRMMTEITDPDSKLVTGYFYLTPLDILKLTFRYLYYVDGHYLRLNKIYDYDPKRRVTKAEFIRVIEAVAFEPGAKSEHDFVKGRITKISGGKIVGAPTLPNGLPNLNNTKGGMIIAGGCIDGATGYADTTEKVINGGIVK